MRSGVDPTSEAAENYQTAGGKIAGQAFGHSHSVGGGVPRADHGDARLGERIHVAAHKKDQWGIVNLLQLLRIGGVIQRTTVRRRRRRAPVRRGLIRETVRFPGIAQTPP